MNERKTFLPADAEGSRFFAQNRVFIGGEGGLGNRNHPYFFRTNKLRATVRQNKTEKKAGIRTLPSSSREVKKGCGWFRCNRANNTGKKDIIIQRRVSENAPCCVRLMSTFNCVPPYFYHIAPVQPSEQLCAVELLIYPSPIPSAHLVRLSSLQIVFFALSRVLSLLCRSRIFNQTSV